MRVFLLVVAALALVACPVYAGNYRYYTTASNCTGSYIDIPINPGTCIVSTSGSASVKLTSTADWCYYQSFSDATCTAGVTWAGRNTTTWPLASTCVNVLLGSSSAGSPIAGVSAMVDCSVSGGASVLSASWMVIMLGIFGMILLSQ
jgi:hypothetical protein